MGDRCYLEITLRKDSLDRATGAVKKCWEKKYGRLGKSNIEWYDSIVDLDNGLAILIIEEANYGMPDELQALAEEKVDFRYFHGAGGTYGPCVGVCLNGELLECSADVEGDPMVVIAESHDIPWEEVRKCWTYHRMVTNLYSKK